MLELLRGEDMKKILLIISLLLFTSCSNKIEEDNMNNYKVILKNLISQEAYINNYKYFDIDLTIDVADKGFSYKLIISNPKIAMYNIKVLMASDDADESYSIIYPNLNIIEDGNYNLIPNQENIEKGFYSTIELDAIFDNDQHDILLAVIWDDFSGINHYAKYYKVQPTLRKYEANNDEQN